MRILYDHQLFSLQDAGGGSRYYYELMHYLSTLNGVSTELVLGMTANVFPFRQLPPRKARITACSAPLGPSMLRYALNEALGNSLAAMRGTYDVYHPTHHRMMPLARARRIVVTHQDCIYERYPVFRYAKQVLREKKLLFAKADVIICISDSAKQDLLEFHHVSPAKTRVVHLGFAPLQRSPAAAQQLRERVKRDYVLYVGKRTVHKNFVRFLNAFCDAGLPQQLDLLLLGGGPLSPEESALIAERKMRDTLILIPRVSDEMLAEAYAAARLFVYPSLWEGFGIPPLEAMDAGCPVAASNQSAIPEVCGDAPFYFDPEDEESMQYTLLQAVEDGEARQRAIARGREVVARYSWEKCGQATLDVYRECL